LRFFGWPISFSRRCTGAQRHREHGVVFLVCTQVACSFFGGEPLQREAFGEVMGMLALSVEFSAADRWGSRPASSWQAVKRWGRLTIWCCTPTHGGGRYLGTDAKARKDWGAWSIPAAGAEVEFSR